MLAAADVHVAVRLAQLAKEEDENTLLATALAVRAPRLGSVCVDLATIAATAATDIDAPIDLQELPWPQNRGMGRRPCLESAGRRRRGGRGGPAAPPRGDDALPRPLLAGRFVAADLLARNEPAGGVDAAVLTEGLARLFDGDEPDLQRLAAATCVLRRLAVVGGGPGTGKTTTVTRILVLLDEQAEAAGEPTPLSRAGRADREGRRAAGGSRARRSVDARAERAERARLLETRASTFHRLLGRRAGSANRFWHDRRNQLPHDVVIVDETSMVSLSMTARLLDAVRRDARLILVGDPKQRLHRGGRRARRPRRPRRRRAAHARAGTLALC